MEQKRTIRNLAEIRFMNPRILNALQQIHIMFSGTRGPC